MVGSDGVVFSGAGGLDEGQDVPVYAKLTGLKEDLRT